ncbi:MAG: nucleoside-diphosphate kinase [Acidimicrobiales bacterium]|jgi:nucleoside-diphosphate kinase|nr:nucleoside-diphosphate kinase [Acidimicrobiaceae bacterium]MDP6076910.1 nucleoside-diphosphate kinase [Acidimicrobiales bacterium]MDP7258696.1 nucleoside-diphosphate kinase [Acidimicrobiales bacterium]HCV36613.1 nucleoside-diphosphate kinase [Acidimicrobiaceae bacterium]HJO79825.1 nucleoside-diphosphate kinase [Acidimicrobiales bacterium]|tara:strand:- start:11125 stop:11544 length:420 start_codon:yes stop_codon:yes gene_type:complete
MEKTLVICKPDAVERGLVGEIIGRLERKGLAILASELRLLDAEQLERHYFEHTEKPFFGDLVAFMSRSPVMLLLVVGPEGTVSVVRTLMGSTDPCQASPGTIRGDFGLTVTENLVHGSDSVESAQREAHLFFPDLELEI